jgi:hypothetical protein
MLILHRYLIREQVHGLSLGRHISRNELEG